MMSGVESCLAMWMPADALVAPGPRVTKQMPGRPVALPTASAIMAAPPSWRQVVTVMRRVAQRIEHRQEAFAGHAEHMLDAVGDKLVDQHLCGRQSFCTCVRSSGSR